uniref:Complement C8 alpha chain n=1 Tax=Latimeria chalumnae TaxID=7897 RepID=H3B2C0_LATCH
MFRSPFLSLAFKECNRTGSSYMKHSARIVRSYNPYAADCQLSQWSKWTSCFPSDGLKHRYRRLLQPAKFGGETCIYHLWDEEACTIDKLAPKDNCGGDFMCEETGRCINRRLLCNGERDCRDESDETGCQDVENESFCSDLFPIPGAENAVQGFNALTQETVNSVLDPQFFGGYCEYVYNGEWRGLKYDSVCENLYYSDDEKYFRKPYNFHLYRFLPYADSGISTEFYDDALDVFNAIKSESSSSFGVTLSISVVELGLNAQKEAMFLKNISQYTEKDVGFIRVSTKITTAHFKMRRNNLVLDEDMYLSLMELPDEYNYGLYAKFINDYGTHYIISGTFGGIFEYILVVNKELMKKAEITSSAVGSCIGASLGLKFNNEEEESALTFRASMNYQSCNKEGHQGIEKDEIAAAIKDILPRVRGGDMESSGRLSNIMDAKAYRYWGRSLKHSPALIDFELQPIYELLHRSKLHHIQTKAQNLRRAWEEYIIEFNACRCGPCQNNGEPILDGHNCICKCPVGYDGLACEKTNRKVGPTHGRWSCWTQWSECKSGSRMRTRECNNPAPKDGGIGCVGKNVQTMPC